MNAAQLSGIRQSAEVWGNSGPYQIVAARGEVIAFGLSYAKAQEWARVYGGATVSRGDVVAFARWQSEGVR
jgi:hypothetical protein